MPFTAVANYPRIPYLHSPLYILIIIFILTAGLPVSALAVPFREQVNEELERVNNDPDLNEATRTSLKDVLNSTLNYLEESERHRAKAAELASAGQLAPEQSRSLQRQIKQLERNPGTRTLESESISSRDIESLEKDLLTEEAHQKSLSLEISHLQKQLSQAAERPDVIQDKLADIASRLSRLQTSLKDEPVLDSSQSYSQVRQWLVEAEIESLTAQQSSFERELLTHQIRSDLMRTQLTLQELLLRNSNQRIQTLQSHLAENRVQEAQATQRSVAKKEEALSGQHPLIKELASRNTTLGNLIAEISQKLTRVEQANSLMITRSLELEEAFRSTQQKIDIAGLSQALGQILLDEKRKLPQPGTIRADSPVNEDIIAEAGLRQIQHEDERRTLRDINTYISNLTKELDAESSAAISRNLTELAEQRRELLEKAIEEDQAYIRALGELDFATRQYLGKVRTYNDFLTEHLLWIRSSPPVNLPMLLDSTSQIQELIDFDQSIRVVKDLGLWARANTGLWLLVLGLLALAFRASILKNRITRLSQPLQRLTTDQYRFTLQTAILTLFLASLLPLIFYVTGYTLSRTPHVSPLAIAVGNALLSVALIVFHFSLLHHLCHPGGIALAHFKWPPVKVSGLKKGVRRYQRLFLPTLFITFVVMNFGFHHKTGALSHLLIVASILAFAYCSHRLLKDPADIFRLQAKEDDKEASGAALKFAKATAILVPAILCIVALSGYLYTVGTLSLHLLNTFVLLIALFLVHQLIIRWLVLAQRKLAYQNALERRQLARQKKAEGEEEGSVTEFEDAQIDLEALSKGSRELLKTVLIISGAIGIWLIWTELLPAFGILEQVAIWEYTDTVAGEDKQIPVTLFDLGLSIVIVVVTLLAAKRVPALLEFIFLQRIKLQAGGLYAVRTLTGYLIVAIGILLALNTIGASWSQIQWLAAALSVGIGFGLQEIVANFISGLIILFERPIRVGDVVTVGDTDGVVTKIKIRATTIRNWDQKELLVPNKEFITNRLLNWTLSDQTNRLLIPVGIAYGSDARRAMELILETASRHPQVLKDPAPMVSFESFGDNALIIYLRSYVSRLDYRLPTITDLHLGIYERLNDAGIGIAFPQRDVHLDTVRPLDIRMVPPEAEPSSG